MGRVRDVQLFTLFRNFLTIYLPVQRKVSENTVVDYRISLNQLIEFISKKQQVPYMSVTFEMITKDNVNSFLDYLTEEKKFAPATRNNRLAAIKSFLSYASGVHPEYISLMGEISTIKIQKDDPFSKVEYMSELAVETILKMPDTRTRIGLRDQFFMILLYDTGARIQEIIDTDVTVQDAAGAKKLEAPRGVVKYDNVAFAYPGADENVLENISFEAKPGQTTAIIGSTGCGKSTLVQLLPRFYDVTEGSITIDGQDIRDLTMESVRQNIGFVPQKGILFSGTIASNIRFGAPDASDEDVKLAAEIAQASDFIEEKEHGYDSAVAQGGGNVSGGQKQRLAIARAIARKPKILIFDDSFSALDFKTDVAVRKALGEHVNDSTVFIVAQRVSTILSADQILVLDEGTIVGKGTHKELMQTCEEYRQIAESQLSPSEIAASLGTDSERQV